jgi:hypothetical protein
MLRLQRFDLNDIKKSHIDIEKEVQSLQEKSAVNLILKSLISQSRTVTSFSYKNSKPLHLMKEKGKDLKHYQRSLWLRKKREEEEAIIHDEMENNGGVAMEDQASLAKVDGIQGLAWID